MIRIDSLWAVCLLSLSCAHSLTTVAAPDCGPGVEGLDAVLTKAATVVVGEMHGTREMPDLFSVVACRVAQRGPVIVGLEVPEGPAVRTFLDGPGGAAATAALLADEWWKAPYQDGRRSVAMLQLLERLRQLKTSGRPVEVLLFDSEAPEAALRDERMAAQIIARRQARPEATVLLLMGNLHARKVLGNPFDGNAQYRWLTSRLPGATVSLIARAPAGSAWVCGGMTADSCGADLIGADPLAKGTAAVVLGLSNDGAFDGTFELPSMTASPPAAFAEVIASFDATLAALKTGPKAMVAQAMRQYDAKDFAACAQTLSALERPTADQLYSRACCQALAGRKDAAFADLKAALAAGFTDEKTLATDPDLESLRSDQRWRTVN